MTTYAVIESSFYWKSLMTLPLDVDKWNRKKIPDDELWRCTCCCCWCCCWCCCCWWCCSCCWKSCLGSSLSARPPSLTSFDSSDSDSKLSSFLLDSKLSSFLLLALATFFCWRLNSCSDSRLQKRKWKVMPVIRRGSNFLVSNKFILELSTYVGARIPNRFGFRMVHCCSVKSQPF